MGLGVVEITMLILSPSSICIRTVDFHSTNAFNLARLYPLQGNVKGRSSQTVHVEPENRTCFKGQAHICPLLLQYQPARSPDDQELPPGALEHPMSRQKG